MTDDHGGGRAGSPFGQQPYGQPRPQPPNGPAPHGPAPRGPQQGGQPPYGQPAPSQWPAPGQAPGQAPTRGYHVPAGPPGTQPVPAPGATQRYPAQPPAPSPQAWSVAPRPVGQTPPGQFGPPGGSPGGPPPNGPSWSGGAGSPGGPGKKRSATPWIAAAGVVVLAAATVVIVLLTNRDGSSADPTDGGPETLGTIRAYPSMEFTTDPADADSQRKAQQVGEDWVQAINDQDLDAAKAKMCRRSQSIGAGELFGGLEKGSMKAENAAVNGKKGSLTISYKTAGGDEKSGAIPMALEDQDWTVCLN